MTLSRSRGPSLDKADPRDDCLFDGFDRSLELEHVGVRQSPHATFIDYRVKRA